MIGYVIASTYLLIAMIVSIAITRSFSQLRDSGEISVVTALGAIFVVGAIVNRSYDFFLKATHSFPVKVEAASFSASTIVILILIICGATQTKISMQPLQTLLWLLFIPLWFLASYEIWKLLKNSMGTETAFILGMLSGGYVFVAGIYIPSVTINRFAIAYNGESSAFLASWTAGLVGWNLRTFVVGGHLEKAAGTALVKAVLERETPTIVAIAIVYVAFRYFSIDNLLFAVVTGAVAAAFSTFFHVLSNEA